MLLLVPDREGTSRTPLSHHLFAPFFCTDSLSFARPPVSPSAFVNRGIEEMIQLRACGRKIRHCIATVTSVGGTCVAAHFRTAQLPVSRVGFRAMLCEEVEFLSAVQSTASMTEPTAREPEASLPRFGTASAGCCCCRLRSFLHLYLRLPSVHAVWRWPRR